MQQKYYIALSDTKNTNARGFGVTKYYEIMEKRGLVSVSVNDVRDLSYITEDLINPIIKRLAGRVLTTVDASIPQGPQNKAMKDIIKEHISQAYEDIQRFTDPNCSKGDLGHLSDEEADEIMAQATEAMPEEVEELLFGEAGVSKK